MIHFLTSCIGFHNRGERATASKTKDWCLASWLSRILACVEISDFMNPSSLGVFDASAFGKVYTFLVFKRLLFLALVRHLASSNACVSAVTFATLVPEVIKIYKLIVVRVIRYVSPVLVFVSEVVSPGGVPCSTSRTALLQE